MVDAEVDIWDGTAHGFLGGIGSFTAAELALKAIGAFLADRLRGDGI